MDIPGTIALTAVSFALGYLLGLIRGEITMKKKQEEEEKRRGRYNYR